ncbi:hypothetical protein BHE74_00009454 [Ensete ventricosum]|nr:hypothetical protein BHE74_00009454 [Ensete ventricosum]
MGSLLPQVSVGTLLAFTIVAVSILILRYIPPDEVPLPSSLRESIDSVSFRYSVRHNNAEKTDPTGIKDSNQNQHDVSSQAIIKESVEYPLIVKENNQGIDGCQINSKLAIYFLICSAGTWLRVSIWLLVGVLVYLFYGRSHSTLTDVVYVPAAHVDEIYKTSENVV